MTQELLSGWRAGETVRVRGDRWRIIDTATFPDCTLLDLAGIGQANAGSRRTLVAPYDRPVPIGRTRRPRVIRRTAWMRAFRSLISHAASAVHLRTAASARVDLLPYQLEPALAMLRGLASRFLLADDVGLGKTIQAALMLAELRARGWAHRALILTPAALRDQWAAELLDRFGISAMILDRHSLRSRASALPRGMNPWSIPAISVASFDFASQPEVLRPLLGVVWDLLLIDEAHHVSAAPERAAAVRALAERSWHVVLITATPHSGDRAAFDSLCDMGRADREGPIAMFRRSRANVGLHVTRRVKVISVTPTEAERRMHRCLEAYASSVWREASGRADRTAQLAMMVLCKRGLSSASSLLQSVERRLALLGGAQREWPQPALPFAPPASAEEGEHDPDDDEPIDLLSSHGLADGDRERHWLLALKQAALEASRSESKPRALARLLSRTAEAAIIFTEFRDTLSHLAERLRPFVSAASLHGGMSRTERRDVCRRFSDGDLRVLLATDVAGQGLNLQSRCRLVINLELPWNPMRLEQRIGRVDRIGQQRTVHACHLIARDTGESRVLVHLTRRLLRARESLGELRSPLGGMTEERIARLMIVPGRETARHQPAETHQPAGSLDAVNRADEPRFFVSRLETPANQEASRAADLRRLLNAGRARAFLRESERPLVTAARRWRPGQERSGLVVLYRVLTSDGAGRVVDETFIPIRCASVWCSLPERPRAVRAWIDSHWDSLDLGLRASVEAHLVKGAKLQDDVFSRLEQLWARGQSLASCLDRAARILPIQIGLFDRRALRRIEQTASELEDERAELQRRLHAAAEAVSVPPRTEISAALILLPPA